MDSSLPQLNTGTPEIILDHPSLNGEGPLWHEEARTLTWLDIPAGQIFRYTPETGTNELVYQHSGEIGGYTIQKDGSLIAFCEKGTILRLIGDMPEVIVERIDAIGDGRFNDVIADPEGRIFAGTMALGNKPAQLYRLDLDGTLTLIYNDLTQGNGMGFSSDLSTYYLTDSNSRCIFAIEYDRTTGELGERRTLITTPDDGSVPDGMAVDSTGNIWSARHGGSGIYKYDANGEVLGKVELPVRNVTSLTFGDSDFSTAFVTTGNGDQRDDHHGLLAGSLFRVDLKVRGKPPFRSRIGMS